MPTLNAPIGPELRRWRPAVWGPGAERENRARILESLYTKYTVIATNSCLTSNEGERCDAPLQRSRKYGLFTFSNSFSSQLLELELLRMKVRLQE